MQSFDPLADVTSRRRAARRWRRIEWLYLVIVCLALLAIRRGGDRWGWATMLAYGPRDAFLIPGILIVLIELLRRRIAWVALLGLGVVAGPLMNFVVPWNRPLQGKISGPVLHLMQLNADGHGTAGRHYDLPRVLSLLRSTHRDIATFEEWPVKAPPPLPAPGWSFHRNYQLMLISRWPIIETRDFPALTFNGRCFAMGCRLKLPAARSQWVFALQLETPRMGFEPILHDAPHCYATLLQCLKNRDIESQVIQQWIINQTGQDRADAVVGGDFNMVGDGVVFRHRWGAWTDAFSAAGFGWGQTKLQFGWRARIDHILAGTARRPLHCWVGPDVNSDHLPVLADIQIRSSNSPKRIVRNEKPHRSVHIR